MLPLTHKMLDILSIFENLQRTRPFYKLHKRKLETNEAFDHDSVTEIRI